MTENDLSFFEYIFLTSFFFLFLNTFFLSVVLSLPKIPNAFVVVEA